MATPVLTPAGPPRVASGARPPRWTYPVLGRRVRVGAGFVGLVAVAAGLGLWGPSGRYAWLPLVGVLGVALSTLLHEGAHAWAAHNLGYRVEWVVLGGLTGTTAYFGRDDRPLDRAAVALAGPAASALLVLVLVALRAAMDDGASLAEVVELATAVNAIALVANLLPFGHTDGAHLLDGLFRHARRS